MAHEAPKNTVESTKVGVRVPSKSVGSSSSSSPTRKIITTTAKMTTADSCRDSHNFKRSAVPVRFMFLNHDGCWNDFPSEVIGSLKSAFVDHKPLVDLSITGSRYLFDFLRMLQTDFDSGCQRSIAWIDEKGKCFFPKKFIGEDFDFEMNQAVNPKIEIDIRINDDNKAKNNDQMKRKREEPEVSSAIKGDDVIKRQRLEKWPDCCRLLSEDEQVYATVRDYFLNGMRKIDPGVSITAIRQWVLEAPMEFARFFTFQEQIEVTKSAPLRDGTSNIVYAWYGAPVKDVESVLLHGFGVPSKVYGPDRHGVGLYLSPVGLPHVSAKLSEVDQTGEKHVVLCKVVLGNLEQVEAGSSQDCPSSSYFDNGTDDTENPKCYVVWPCNMSRHIIPECVVSFKHSLRYLQGQLKGSPGVRYSLEKLLSKMKNLLPASKLQEVETLYNTFKVGKLARDLFIKQMRLIAGDEVLLSTIRAIEGQE